jgi:hypothetical protein
LCGPSLEASHLLGASHFRVPATPGCQPLLGASHSLVPDTETLSATRENSNKWRKVEAGLVGLVHSWEIAEDVEKLGLVKNIEKAGFPLLHSILLKPFTFSSSSVFIP